VLPRLLIFRNKEKDKKFTLTPDEILKNLDSFFSKNEEKSKEFEEIPDVEMKLGEEEKARDDHDLVGAPIIKYPTFRVRKVSKSRDMSLAVDNIFEEDGVNVLMDSTLQEISLQKRVNKIFKIEQTKEDDRDAKSEGDRMISDEQALETNQENNIKPNKKIDELFDEMGRIRNNTPVVRIFDKKLNEQLESLMKDFRGRARKVKYIDENKEEMKEENQLNRNLA